MKWENIVCAKKLGFRLSGWRQEKTAASPGQCLNIAWFTSWQRCRQLVVEWLEDDILPSWWDMVELELMGASRLQQKHVRYKMRKYQLDSTSSFEALCFQENSTAPLLFSVQTQCSLSTNWRPPLLFAQTCQHGISLAMFQFLQHECVESTSANRHQHWRWQCCCTSHRTYGLDLGGRSNELRMAMYRISMCIYIYIHY